MRYNFLLDVNILHHAIRGVDRQENPDATCAELIHAIVRICHAVTIHESLQQKYWSDLQELFRVRPSHLEPLFFINEVIRRSEKRELEYNPLPDLPLGVKIPTEDIDVVRAALLSRPIIVTADVELLDAVNTQPILGLRALNPKDALDFAQRNLPEILD
ncbi:MAG: hypothetical protein ACYDA9_04495 [Terriglobia bacterium]